MSSSSLLPADRHLKLAAWASLVLAIACWPLALYSFGLVMGESFGPDAQRLMEFKRFWTPIVFGALLFSFLASAWLSGLSIRRAPVVAACAISIDTLAMVGVLSTMFDP